MRKKFFITTTIPGTLGFFRGNLKFLNKTFDVHAISSQKERLEKIGKEEGVRTHYIPMERSISLLKDILSLFKFLWLFIKEKPDIVHGNTPKAAMLSMLAAKLTGVKVRIYMCHGLRYQGTSGRMRWLLMQMEKLTCACAIEVICVSKGVRDNLIKDGLCKESKAIVVHNGSAAGIDLDKFDSNLIEYSNIRKKLGIDKDDFVFIFVGRIVKDKGINELINAFVKLQKTISSTHLLLVGREESDLNSILDRTRILIKTNKNIHAVGHQKDIRPYLLSSNAFILPSYREGLPTVLMEAGALGLPSITTDTTGCNEVIIDRLNGEIVPPRNQTALYEKMKEWIESPEKVATMGSKARHLVEARFEQSIVWNAQLDEYKRLTKDV